MSIATDLKLFTFNRQRYTALELQKIHQELSSEVKNKSAFQVAKDRGVSNTRISTFLRDYNGLSTMSEADLDAFAIRTALNKNSSIIQDYMAEQREGQREGLAKKAYDFASSMMKGRRSKRSNFDYETKTCEWAMVYVSRAKLL